MSSGATGLDFDSVTISWPTTHAGRDRLNQQIYALLREKLPSEHPQGYEVGGYGSDPKRGTERVTLTADAGHGPALLAWARHHLQNQPLPQGATITLEPAHGREAATTPLQPEPAS